MRLRVRGLRRRSRPMVVADRCARCGRLLSEGERLRAAQAHITHPLCDECWKLGPEAWEG